MASTTTEIIAQSISGLWTIVGAVIGLVGGYFVSRKKYAFEKIYEQKLLCLKDLYGQIIYLEFALKKYVHITGADMNKETKDERVKELSEVKNSFQKFQHKFWREKIILDEQTIKTIEDFLTKYIEITSKLTVSNIQYQQGDLRQSFDNWDKSFNLVEKDLSEVKNKLEEEFRKTLKITS